MLFGYIVVSVWPLFILEGYSQHFYKYLRNWLIRRVYCVFCITYGFVYQLCKYSCFICTSLNVLLNGELLKFSWLIQNFSMLKFCLHCSYHSLKCSCNLTEFWSKFLNNQETLNSFSCKIIFSNILIETEIFIIG